MRYEEGRETYYRKGGCIFQLFSLFLRLENAMGVVRVEEVQDRIFYASIHNVLCDSKEMFQFNCAMLEAYLRASVKGYADKWHTIKPGPRSP